MPEATTRRLLLALTAVMAGLLCVPLSAPGKALDPSKTASRDFWSPQPEKVRVELVRIPGSQRFDLAIATPDASGRPKWLSRDPLGESGGLNLYGFVNNDPINSWDYLGMAPDGPGGFQNDEPWMDKLGFIHWMEGGGEDLVIGKRINGVATIFGPHNIEIEMDTLIDLWRSETWTPVASGRGMGAGVTSIIAGWERAGKTGLGRDLDRFEQTARLLLSDDQTGGDVSMHLAAATRSAALAEGEGIALGLPQSIAKGYLTAGMPYLTKAGFVIKEVGGVMQVFRSGSSRAVGTLDDLIHIGSATGGGRVPVFNPAGGTENCAACVSAFLRTSGSKTLSTAVDIERAMGSSLGRTGTVLSTRGKALSYIQEAAGISLSARPASGAFAGRFAAELARGDYVLLAQEHVMIGRVLSNGKRIIYDVQNQAMLTWDEATRLFGEINAYRVLGN